MIGSIRSVLYQLRHITRLSPTKTAQARLSPFVLGAALSLVVGVVSGLGAVVFRNLIDLFQSLFFTQLRDALSVLGPYAVIPLPALGGVAVGLLVYFLAREARGHGVPEVMLAVDKAGGHIRGRVAVVKALASSICIGSGGSVGREGPIVQIGSAAASFLGKRFAVSENWLRLLVACGAAGGISATFNAPIAGVFFALEVILRTFTIQNFGVVVLSSVTADAVAHSFLGDTPAFPVPLYALNSLWELLPYTLLGVFAAILGLAFMRTLYFLEDRFDNLSVIPEFVKPAIGGLLVGTIGVFYPQVFGVGYGSISEALGGGFPLVVLGALIVFKLLATSLTLGSGGSGGVFAPSLFIGAMAGTAFGRVVGALFPGIAGPAGGYGLVGMASTFAGAAWAPMTAILIVFEMTRDYNIILPLMLGVVTSTTLSRHFSRDSIYTLKLTRRGVDLRRHGHDIADTVRVGEIMTRGYPTIAADVPVRDLPAEFERHGVHGLPVLNALEELVGMVTVIDVERALINGSEGRSAYDIAARNLVTAYPDQILAHVLRRVGADEVGYIPVVSREHPRRLLGVLRRHDIVRTYAKAARQRAEEGNGDVG